MAVRLWQCQDLPFRMLAEDVCRTCGKTVVCTGGVHLENITAEQINEVRIAAEQLEEMLISELN